MSVDLPAFDSVCVIAKIVPFFFFCFTCMYNIQVLFIKWVLTIFDLIDAKDQLRAIYGFIFSFVTEENLVRDDDVSL